MDGWVVSSYYQNKYEVLLTKLLTCLSVGSFNINSHLLSGALASRIRIIRTMINTQDHGRLTSMSVSMNTRDFSLCDHCELMTCRKFNQIFIRY